MKQTECAASCKTTQRVVTKIGSLYYLQLRLQTAVILAGFFHGSSGWLKSQAEFKAHSKN